MSDPIGDFIHEIQARLPARPDGITPSPLDLAKDAVKACLREWRESDRIAFLGPYTGELRADLCMPDVMRIEGEIDVDALVRAALAAYLPRA